jgi:hypothetical protein
MEKKQLHRLLNEIAGGGETTGEEAHDKRLLAEADVTVAISKEYGGILLFGDSLHQFYTDTIRELSTHHAASIPPSVQIAFHWHIVSLSRYFTSFDLLKRGYFFESATLSRTLWETALTLAGLKREIVPVADMFGGIRQEGLMHEPRQVIDRVKKSDKAIQDRLIWKNSDLTVTAREAINTFYGLMNQATHKSNLALMMNLKRQLNGESIPTLPKFEPGHVEVAWNILHLAMWCLMVTLAYLKELSPPLDSSWHARYKKLLLVFEELNKAPPNKLVEGFGEVVRKVFVI